MARGSRSGGARPKSAMAPFAALFSSAASRRGSSASQAFASSRSQEQRRIASDGCLFAWNESSPKTHATLR